MTGLRVRFAEDAPPAVIGQVRHLVSARAAPGATLAGGWPSASAIPQVMVVCRRGVGTGYGTLSGYSGAVGPSWSDRPQAMRSSSPGVAAGVLDQDGAAARPGGGDDGGGELGDVRSDKLGDGQGDKLGDGEGDEPLRPVRTWRAEAWAM